MFRLLFAIKLVSQPELLTDKRKAPFLQIENAIFINIKYRIKQYHTAITTFRVLQPFLELKDLSISSVVTVRTCKITHKLSELEWMLNNKPPYRQEVSWKETLLSSFWSIRLSLIIKKRSSRAPSASILAIEHLLAYDMMSAILIQPEEAENEARLEPLSRDRKFFNTRVLVV